MTLLARRCLGAAAGLVIDRLIGEPPTPVHPVAWFGTAMGRVEEVLWSDRRLPGAAYTAAGVGLGVAFGRLVRYPAVAVAVTVAGRELRTVAAHIGDVAGSGSLAEARLALPALVGRDPGELDASGIAAAVVESVAENSVDAVVAPVWWALIAGAPGATAYRAVNTMDAMVGHRSERYRRFGWASARLDDAANYVPARLFAGLICVVAPRRSLDVIRILRRDAPAHPSPNAGVAESAAAAALELEVGGPLRYGDRVELRPRLGEGPRPQPSDVARAVRLAARVELALVVVLVAAAIIDVARATLRGSHFGQVPLARVAG